MGVSFNVIVCGVGGLLTDVVWSVIVCACCGLCLCVFVVNACELFVSVLSGVEWFACRCYCLCVWLVFLVCALRVVSCVVLYVFVVAILECASLFVGFLCASACGVLKCVCVCV